MKKIIGRLVLLVSFVSISILACGQTNTYWHDRIDTTIYATTTGTNTYTGTNLNTNFNVNKYVRGLLVSTFFVNGNTGASTYRLVTASGTLSTVPIRKAGGVALSSGDIPDSTAVLLLYYGSFWRLVGIHSGASTGWMLLGNLGTTAGTNFVGTTDAQDLVFKSNSSESMRIQTSTNNVGIGTASPAQLLEVNKSTLNDTTLIKVVNTKVTIPFTNVHAGIELETDDGKFFITRHSSGTATPDRTILNEDNSLGFTVNTVNAVNISNTGNVGILTTTPASAFHVNGITRFGLASATNASLILQNSTNANTLTINSGVTSSSHSWTLPLAQGAASTSLQNDGSGVLSWVVPTAASVGAWALAGNTLTGTEHSPTEFFGSNNNFDVVFKENTAEIMRFRDALVGIGIAIPTAKLDIKGTGASSATFDLIVNNSTGTSNSLVVRGDARVGIGIASPVNALTVHYDAANEVSIGYDNCISPPTPSNMTRGGAVSFMSPVFAPNYYNALYAFDHTDGYQGMGMHVYRYFQITDNTPAYLFQMKGSPVQHTAQFVLNNETDEITDEVTFKVRPYKAASNIILEVTDTCVTNTTAAQDVYGAKIGRIGVNNSGGGKNIGLKVYAKNSTTANYAIVVPSGQGLIGFGTETPGSQLQVVNTNTAIPAFQAVGSASVTIAYDGRLFGTAIHNNTGSVTGTTNQYIASGTYTFTPVNVANVAASTAYPSQWMRVGNVVTVSGKVDIDATLAVNTATELGIPLPIASNLTAEENCAGDAVSDVSVAGLPALSARVKADAANDRAAVSFNSLSLTNDPYSFQFTYVIQ